MALEISTENAQHPAPGILVDNQIRSAMDRGILVIDPFDETGLEPATYDLRVGQYAIASSSSQRIDLSEQTFLTIEPFSVALLQTEEVLKLSSRMVGRVGPRSNILRSGIFVSTGPQIDPGFSGRLFVTLLNVTDHPFLIRYLDKFLTIEFHGLSQTPTRTYEGKNQNKVEPSLDEINAILSRGGPALKDIHRDMLDMMGPLREAGSLVKEMPKLIDLQYQTLQGITKMSAVHLTRDPSSITVPITDLGSQSHILAREIPVVIQGSEDGYTATFFDANVTTSGDTQEEALSNLKSLLIDLLDDLENEDPNTLGPEPQRQLEVLGKLIIRKT